MKVLTDDDLANLSRKHGPFAFDVYRAIEAETIKRLAAGVSVEPVERKAWLIEVNQGVSPAPIWLAHYLGDDYFTTDANTAIHFPTERSAKDVLDALFDYKRKKTALGFTYKSYAVTEHLFLDTLDQLTTAIAAARVQENERCVQACAAKSKEYLARSNRGQHSHGAGLGAAICAELIRALLGKEQS